HEIRHARIVGLVTQPPDVELGNMACRIVHGFAPSRLAWRSFQAASSSVTSMPSIVIPCSRLLTIAAPARFALSMRRPDRLTLRTDQPDMLRSSNAQPARLMLWYLPPDMLTFSNVQPDRFTSSNTEPDRSLLLTARRCFCSSIF